MTNDESDLHLAQYASIGYSTVIGLACGGVPTAIVGFTIGVIDEILISNKVFNKHYLSSTAFYYKIGFLPWINLLVKHYPGSNLPIHFVALGFTQIISYNSDDFMDFNNRLEIPVKAFFVLEEVFDPKRILSTHEVKKITDYFYEDPIKAMTLIKNDLEEIYHNNFLNHFIIIGLYKLTVACLEPLTIYFLNRYHQGNFIVTLRNAHPDGFSKVMLFEAMKVISIMFFSTLINNDINNQLTKLDARQSEIIVEKATSFLLDDDNSRKILAFNKDKGQEAMNYIFYDLFTLIRSAQNLNIVIYEVTQNTIAVYNIVHYNPMILLPYVIFNVILEQTLLISIVDQLEMLAIDKAVARSKAHSLVSDVINKAEAIATYDGQEFMRHKFNSWWNKMKIAEIQEKALAHQQTMIQQYKEIYTMIVDLVYFTSLKIADHSIPLAIFSKNLVVSALFSNIKSKSANIEIIQSKERFGQFLEIISLKVDNAEHLITEDGNIVFQDYTLFLGTQKLVQIDSLTLEKGKRYAITGSSGCGKSSTLLDLKKGVVEPLSSYGKIYHPDSSEIMLIDQNLYIPKDATLLEVIFFPSVIEFLSLEELTSLRSFVIILFKELQIDEFVDINESKEGLSVNLETQNFKLSGGQQQKISLIKAVLKNPAVLIIDESFARLDSISVIKFQNVILQYLSETTLLVVDHKVNSHNFNNFYDKEIHFENNQITVNIIENTSLPIMDVEAETLPGQVVDVPAFF